MRKKNRVSYVKIAIEQVDRNLEESFEYLQWEKIVHQEIDLLVEDIFFLVRQRSFLVRFVLIDFQYLIESNQYLFLIVVLKDEISLFPHVHLNELNKSVVNNNDIHIIDGFLHYILNRHINHFVAFFYNRQYSTIE